MIQIRYSPPHDLDVSGNPSELQQIRQDLLALSTGSMTAIMEPADGGIDPAPYAIALIAFRAQATQGPTKIAVIGSEVVVEGSADTFEAFASYFDFPQDAVPLQHTHHEFFEGDKYIHQDSIPMVIGICKEEDN